MLSLTSGKKKKKSGEQSPWGHGTEKRVLFEGTKVMGEKKFKKINSQKKRGK